MWDAILFDNDGVLVDTEGLYFRANREVLAGVGVDLDEAAYVELFLREGLGAWHLAEARGHSPASIEALRAARDRRYFELVDEGE
ncbi:MAG TPA: HAD family phosphatase, partial [Polyangia bacterium]|nr:HAD family phosphatase [Polyangia bacterium]